MNEPIPHSDFHHSYVEAQRADPRPNAELIQMALSAKDDEAYWAAVAVLWYRPQDQVIAMSQRLLASSAARERALGAHILSSAESMSPDESLALLLPVLEVDQDAEVLGAIGFALGQIGDPRAIAPLIQLKDHPNAQARYGVVLGLLPHPDDQAVAILTELSADPDVKVRNWATFGLGLREDIDTPAIRAALWARVTDENDEVRAEALEGLALRNDPNIVEPLLQELASVEEEMWPPLYRAALEAGTRLGDARLYDALVRLRTFVAADEIDEELEAAIKNSTPAPTAQ